MNKTNETREFQLEGPCPQWCPECDVEIGVSNRFCWQCGYEFPILFRFYWAIVEERLKEELGPKYVASIEAPLCHSQHRIYAFNKLRFCPHCGTQLV